jgi:hypothetical protein
MAICAPQKPAVQLTSDLYLDGDPCFSPDGTRILFEAWSEELGDTELFSIDLNGDNLIRLTTSLEYDGQVSCPMQTNKTDGMICTQAQHTAAGQQPPGSTVPYIGANIYNTNSAGQTLWQMSRGGQAAVFRIRVENESSTSASIKITASSGIVGWTARYFDVTAGENTEITSDITGAGWFTPPLSPSPGGAVELRVEITPDGIASPGSSFEFWARSAAPDDSGPDVVKGLVTRYWTVDAQIRSYNQLGWAGANEYSPDGIGQVAAQALMQISDGPVSYFIKVRNDGGDSQPLRITAPIAGPGWTARFYDAVRGGSDISSYIAGSGWLTPSLASGQSSTIRMELALSSEHTLGQLAENLIRVDATQGSASDVVKASLGLQRIQKVQYSFDYGQSWTDAPSVGQTIVGKSKIPFGLRAVPEYPDLPWPSQPKWQPRWVDNSQDKVGSQIWIYYPVPQSQAQNIVASCGNSISVEVNVSP